MFLYILYVSNYTLAYHIRKLCNWASRCWLKWLAIKLHRRKVLFSAVYFPTIANCDAYLKSKRDFYSVTTINEDTYLHDPNIHGIMISRIFGLFICYIPRFFYLIKLFNYIGCDSIRTDTSEDRHGILVGMIDRIISDLLTLFILIIGEFGMTGSVHPYITCSIYYFIVDIGFVCWWKHDIEIWE